MALIILSRIRNKINAKHNITGEEVEQCFMNRDGPFIEDTREKHATATGAPTRWFIGETDTGRRLKIVFVLEHRNIYLRTAFPPTESQTRHYFNTISTWAENRLS